MRIDWTILWAWAGALVTSVLAWVLISVVVVKLCRLLGVV